MKQIKTVFFALSFVVCVCAVQPDISIAKDNQPTLPVIGLQNSFRSVAQRVYPAVVSITTVQLENQQGRVYYVPYQDPLFDSFFGDYFGQQPRRRLGGGVPEHDIKRVGIGSGVIIDARGYVLTNYHVVEKAYENKVTIKLADGREVTGIVQGADPRFDIAIVKINGTNFLAADLGNSNELQVGDWAIAIGNPYGFAFDDAQPTMTVGVISALNRSLPGWVGLERAYHDLIQTDAAINMGNSGGPLVNINGEVIGINVAIVSLSGGSQGLGFAIPSNLCKDVISEIIEGKEVLYSWLGVSVQNITPELAEYFHYPNREGVVVIKALPDSPARISGIRDGDIITYYNEKKIQKVEDLLAAVNMTRVGDKITVTVFRDELETELDVIMGSRPRDLAGHTTMDSLYWRGMRVDNITYEMARDLGVSNKKGVVVTDVEPGTPVESANLTVGEVITEINNAPIKDVDDYYAAIYDLRGDILIKTLRGYFVVKDVK